MFGGQSVWQSLFVWLGLLGSGMLASAQEPLRANLASSFAQDRVHEIRLPEAGGKFYFGIMGQVARPGVYELTTPEPQLLELIRYAGGLTQQATNQLRIVRQGNAGQQAFYDATLNYALAPGDIVVADGPPRARSTQRLSKPPAQASEIQTADFVEPHPGNAVPEPIHIALIGVLDRPVILPVPESHANVPGVVAYLGQDPNLASQVKVLPVGRRGADSQTPNGVVHLTVPSVLYFNQRQIVAAALPQFPEVYRTEERSPPQTKPEEIKTADVSPAPAALPLLPVPALMVPPVLPDSTERLNPPVPHSEVVLPAPSAALPSEPPMISSLRKLEQQIPSPRPLKSKTTAKILPPSPTPVTSADLRDESRESEASAKTSSWWLYLGLVLLGLAGAGVYARLRRTKKSPGLSSESFVPVLIEETETKAVQETPRKQPPSASPPIALDEDILTALVFNQLPIVDETPEPLPPEDKPASRKIFRLDPPEEEAQAALRKPHLHNRPPVKPAPEKPAPLDPTAKKPQETLSLLDRVLKRATERRAA